MNAFNYFISSIMFIVLFKFTLHCLEYGCLLCYSEGGGCFACYDGYYKIDKSCHYCGTGCKGCSDSSSCYSCYDGYYLSSSKCNRCDSNCQTCQSTSTKCQSCYDGYYLSSNTCKKCNSPCKTCTSPTTCKTCIDGYYFSSQKCNQCNSLCKTCSNEVSCDSCINGYFLLSKNCYQCNYNCKTTKNDKCKCETCNDGYYLSKYQCLECDISCKTCSVSANNCLTCNEGFYLGSSNSCEECSQNCKECENSTVCSKCIDNYFLHFNECYQCMINCKTSTDNCKCNSCDEGYFLSNFQCLECDTNCKTCSDSANNCLTCKEGYYLSSSNSCEKCIDLCKKCSSSTNCLLCTDNYFFYLDKCYQCNVNCKTSTDNCKCNSCDEGYYLLNYQCLKCDTNCKTCSGSANNCLTCDNGFYLSSSNSCEKCVESCETCSSSTKCLSCKDNYFLFANKCNQCNMNCKISNDGCKCITCKTGYYFYYFQCLNCDINCKTCDKKDNNCTSCDTNKYLFENSCLNCDESECNNKETNITEKEQEIKFYDEILENIDLVFTSEFFDTSFIDNGNDELYEIEKIKIFLTTSMNQKNNENENMTSIDLGKCETLLKNFYNITEEKLYIKKVDIMQENMNIPKIEYSVYSKLNGSNLIKLNLSICQDNQVSLLIPIQLSESLDKLNPTSDYFNSICYTSTSENGTDIPLKDRQKEFKDQNKAVCQEDCKLYSYNYTTRKANCSCKTKEMPLSFADMHINKTKLYQNFLDIKNIANINILICYKNLLEINGIIYNVGSYIIIAILIFHIICFIVFYLKQFNKLKKKIKNITFAIKNKKTMRDIGKNRKKEDKGKNKKERSRNLLKNNDNNKNKIKSIFKKNKTKKRNNKLNNPIKRDNSLNNINKEVNKKIKIPIETYLISKNLSKKIKKRNRSKLNLNTTSKKKINKKEKIGKKIKKILAYIDEEKNSLPYDLAIKYDKRKYWEFYIALLKTQHEFIFSFFQGNDYNSRIIKIDLFFVGFTALYAVNGLFFDDDTMHKIYQNSGAFDLEYQITKIIYSSLISIVINKILGLLALSNNAVIKFKENKHKKDVDIRKKNLEKNLSIKFILYFILSFVFLLFFWYYIAMFGVIYRNTQLHLLEDTLISLGLSMMYPLVIYLLPGLFRIPALSDKNAKKKFLYEFSKLLQLF